MLRFQYYYKLVIALFYQIKWDLVRVDHKLISRKSCEVDVHVWVAGSAILLFLFFILQLLRHHHKSKYYLVWILVRVLFSSFLIFWFLWAGFFSCLFMFRHTFLLSRITLIYGTIQVFLVFGMSNVWFLILFVVLKTVMYFNYTISWFLELWC